MKRPGPSFVLGRQTHVRTFGSFIWRALAIVGILIVAILASWGRATPSGADACRHPAADYAGGGGNKGADPLLEQQWGLRRINAASAWEKGAMGSGAVIAILDTGIDLRHPDLSDRLVQGIDLASKSDCIGPQDESGHGTMVAGVAAATADNGIGIAGVAPRARLMPVRVLTGLECTNCPDQVVDTNRTFAKGIKWAADRGAHVINISSTLFLVTDYPVEDDGLEQAIEYAWQKGSIVVVAAGNNLLPICDYPANHARAVCVGATDELGLPAAYSNQPVNSNSMTGLRAPGGRLGTNCADPVDIWTTTLPGDCSAMSGYATSQGTSFASPHVAGVAALLAGEGLSNEAIIECLTSTALNPLTGLRGRFDPIYGYGEVDAAAAVQECA